MAAGAPRRAEPVYTPDDQLAANTGWAQDPETWRQNQDRRQRLADQTERQAQALERQGIQARRPAERGHPVLVGDVTGQASEPDDYRPICFLPIVAQRKRRPILNELRYWQRHSQLGPYLRYAVITSGSRVPLHGSLRKRICELNRRISKWAWEAERRWGIAVIYRGIEITVDEAGATFHPHANVLYAPRRKLPEPEWQAFLSWSWRFLGAHWQDNGRLENPDEAIKYPFKGDDLEGTSDEGLAWLYRETWGLKIAQPLGEFREWRRSLHDAGYKIASLAGKRGPRLVRVERAKGSAGRDTGTGSGPGENEIVGRMAPVFLNTPYAEPMSLVFNYTPNPKTSGGAARLAILQARQQEARQVWDANGAPDPETALAVAQGRAAAAEGEAGKVAPFSVHTATSTVRGANGSEAPGDTAHRSNNPAQSRGDPPCLRRSAG